MRFVKIKFTNYRCFQDGEIDFTFPKRCAAKRNIILCSWENGGGKTNLMFAFRFALYGMKEEEYAEIPGQENTPWALNQNIYSELYYKGRLGDSKNASVELSFEYKGMMYTVKRMHVFSRSDRGISGPIEKVALLVQDKDGDTSGPYQDPAEVRRQIERIIPERTLYAILCDGERVRKLSSTGAETNQAIRAVIARMTEHELLNLVAKGLEKVRKQIHRKITSGASKDDDRMIAVKCCNLQKNIDDDLMACKVCEQRIDGNKKKLADISKDLEQIEAVKQLERDRVREEKLLASHEDELATAQKKLLGTLNRQSYWSLSGKLCDTVQKLMEDTTLRFPGLEAAIVEMVMKGDTCICGRPIDDEIRECMAVLRKKLPPFNVDAILSGVMHEYGTKDRRSDYANQIAERIGTMNEVQDKINTANQNIAELRKRIEESNNPNARSLEEKREILTSEILKYERDNAVRQSGILRMRAELAELTRRLKEITKKAVNGKELAEKLDYVEGAERGIEAIKQLKEGAALKMINQYLSDAFGKLRSESDSQRQVYITQYEEQHRLVVYHEMRVASEMAAIHSGDVDAIREKVILKYDTGNSMGQLKMVSLAFMKAILSYVHAIALQDKNLDDAEYPVLMDAPFGDIKGENYDNAVEYMHTFADQVIILLADKDIPAGIEPYVARRYSVKKAAAKDGEFNRSVIIEVK